MAKSKPALVLKIYLIIYNIFSFYGWGVLLYRTVDHLVLTQNPAKTYQSVSDLMNLVQSFAVLEIIHTAFGLVKSGLITTIMQVFSRLFIVWGVLDQFSQNEVNYAHQVRNSGFVSSMIIAWSVTEVIRYSFYALQLTFGDAPYISVWSRYTFFYILYPVGAGSEFMCVWNALPFASGSIRVVLIAATLVYGPGFYVMYTHMIKQRKKTLRAGKTKTQ